MRVNRCESADKHLFFRDRDQAPYWKASFLLNGKVTPKIPTKRISKTFEVRLACLPVLRKLQDEFYRGANGKERN